MIFRCLLLLSLLATAAPLLADELRPVSIQLEQLDARTWAVSWKQPLAGVPGEDRAVPTLPSACRYRGEPHREFAAMAVIGEAKAVCRGDIAGARVGWPALVAHGDAILRVAPLDRPVQVHRLTVDAPSAAIARKPSATQVWRSYFAIGVEHILTGWDHLLFVVALVLLVAQPWPVVKAATAFTIAHSLTLAAVTLGFAGLPQRPVEALIALSIVFVALEILRDRPDTLARRLPWLIAFGFGLLHGFGFAGALHEIGMPEGEVPAALLSFNLGVEAGQLAIVAAVLAVRAGLRRGRPALEAPALRIASYAIGITSSYWLIDRIAV